MTMESSVPNILKNYHLLQTLQERGYKVEAIQNPFTNKFDENLLSVNDMLCFVLPLEDSPKVLSSTILEDTDYIIATKKDGTDKYYYIIPSDLIAEKKVYYDVDYYAYQDAWEFFEL